MACRRGNAICLSLIIIYIHLKKSQVNRPGCRMEHCSRQVCWATLSHALQVKTATYCDHINYNFTIKIKTQGEEFLSSLSEPFSGLFFLGLFQFPFNAHIWWKGNGLQKLKGCRIPLISAVNYPTRLLPPTLCLFNERRQFSTSLPHSARCLRRRWEQDPALLNNKRSL